MTNPIALVSDFLANGPAATVLVYVLALAGAVVTITNPDALSFEDYAKIVGATAGLLGIGRGIAASKK